MAELVQCGACTWITEEFDDTTCSRVFRCSYSGRKVSWDGFGYCKHYDSKSSYDDGCKDNADTGCFLTSACVEYLGKADDCEDLTMLRAFRDSYMNKTEDGKMLVEEYYVVAPTIVEKINASEKQDEYYSYINVVIDECVALIKKNKNEDVLEKYKQMVICLKKEFEL